MTTPTKGSTLWWVITLTAVKFTSVNLDNPPEAFRFSASTLRPVRQTPVEVGLLIYPDCQLSAVDGLTDLYRLGEQLNGSGGRQIRISHWKFDEAGLELVRVFDTHGLVQGPLTALVLPPSLDAEPGGNAIARYRNWLITQHSVWTILCSVCAGAFLLAEAGLLNGGSATTHWIHAQPLAARFPAVRIDTENLSSMTAISSPREA